jgi:hypothetical protein
VAPLAFVAYLLPNTENLFNKWRKLFMTLLLMFPIIAALFGASALASKIIMSSSDDMVVRIMAACIAILPLALTPLVMKTAGGVLNRFGGIVNNSERGPIDRLKKAGAGYRETRKITRDNKAFEGARQGGRGAFVRWRAQRGAIAAGVRNQKGRTEQQYLANTMTDQNGAPTAFAKKVAGGTSTYDKASGTFSLTADPAALQRALSGAQFTIERAELEDVKAAHSEVDKLDANVLKNIIHAEPGKESSANIAAAIERYVKIADTKDIAEVADRHATGGKSTLITRVLADSLAQNGSQALKAPDIDNIARGQMGFNPDKNRSRATFQEVISENTASKVWSQEKMVSGSNDDLRYSYQVATDEGKDAMRTRARELIQNPNLNGKIKHNENTIYQIAGMTKTDDGPVITVQSNVPPSGATTASGSSTYIKVNHSGSASAGVLPKPQPARESQEQAKAAVIARARQRAASSGQQGSGSGDTDSSSGF